METPASGNGFPIEIIGGLLGVYIGFIIISYIYTKICDFIALVMKCVAIIAAVIIIIWVCQRHGYITMPIIHRITTEIVNTIRDVCAYNPYGMKFPTNGGVLQNFVEWLFKIAPNISK
jgi:hypothetical protein